MFVNEFFFSFFLLSFAAVLFLFGSLLVADGITRLVREQYAKMRSKSSADARVSKATIKAADHRPA
jgi:cytoskeletal protein RodZ